MKIPSRYYLSEKMGTGMRIVRDWQEAAMELMLEYGIFIDVKVLYENEDSDKITEFVFEVDNHTFGSLTELKKALANKAFL